MVTALTNANVPSGLLELVAPDRAGTFAGVKHYRMYTQDWATVPVLYSSIVSPIGLAQDLRCGTFDARSGPKRPAILALSAQARAVNLSSVDTRVGPVGGRHLRTSFQNHTLMSRSRERFEPYTGGL